MSVDRGDVDQIASAVGAVVSREVGKVQAAHKQSYRYLNKKINDQGREIRNLKKWKADIEKDLQYLYDRHAINATGKCD